MASRFPSPRGGAWQSNGEWDELRDRLRQLRQISPKFVGLIAVVLFLLWALTGVYIVGPGEQGVVLQFGRVVNTTGPGLNYRIPWPIQQVRVVNVEAIQRLEVGFHSAARQPGAVRPVPVESLMLTGDENIVDAQLIVQYRISDPIRSTILLSPDSRLLRYLTDAKTGK